MLDEKLDLDDLHNVDAQHYLGLMNILNTPLETLGDGWAHLHKNLAPLARSAASTSSPMAHKSRYELHSRGWA